MAPLPRPKSCHPNLHEPKPKLCHPRPTTPNPRPKPCHFKPNALPSQAKTSHTRAPHAEQPTLVGQPALVGQLVPAAQLALMASQAAQVGPRLSQPFGPTIEPGAFSPYFSTDLTFFNSNLVPGVYHLSTAQGGTFLPSFSNPNDKQHLS
ncbi:hypothetical protein TB1_023963 [Malus domestica]